MNDYNGWKNRNTWNIALWIGNDEGIYRAARAKKQELANEGKTFTLGKARRFVTCDLMPEGTPDIRAPRVWVGVDWPAIAECLNEL